MNEKDKRTLCNNFIEQIEKIIVDHIPNNSPFSITINNFIKITNKNKTWIIASDPEYSWSCDFYANDTNYSIVKSRLTIPKIVYQYIEYKKLEFQEFKDRTKVCLYLYELSEELNQCMCNELTDYGKLDKIRYFDFITSVKEKTKEFKSSKYPKGYSDRIKMVVYDYAIELRFFNKNGTYNELRFVYVDSQAKNNKQNIQNINGSHISNILITKSDNPYHKQVFQLIEERIKNIHKSSGYNKERVTEEFDSEDQVFEYFKKLFSDSIYQYYGKPINTTDKSISVENLPRICAATNASALQQNTTDMLGHNSLEDSNDNNIAVILIPIFAIFAVVVILIAYYKNCYQGRNLNRSPNVNAMRNRRKLKVLGKNDEQLEEKECLSTKEEDEQQSNLDNEASELSPYSGTSSYTSSSASIAENGQSPRSNTLSRVGSSSSSTTSRARSSVSVEDEQLNSNLKEVAIEDPSKFVSPRTSMENVQDVGSRSSLPIAAARKMKGYLRDGCY